jgi:hypothetical protein
MRNVQLYILPNQAVDEITGMTILVRSILVTFDYYVYSPCAIEIRGVRSSLTFILWDGHISSTITD